ncbi:MAG TPA: EAL domain-containing protein, partial [Methylomirabilota bacterium]|jgi:diguanylate cyclase (GGDEF)-like protein|nr:EAL domain-containing protein [Methylomirabilota bacterium]
MDVEIKREAAFAGQRVKQKVIFALALCSVIPLLVLTYVIHGHLVPGIESPTKGLAEALAIPTLVAFTGLLMAGGGYVVWDLASAVSRTASLVATAQPAGEMSGPRHDEIGTLMVAFNRMMGTIEQQADEINQFPKRLEQLTRQAFRDALTGLPNRALFMDRLSHGLTRARRRHEHVAVLFLDLDRFKVINDTLGHTVGDQLLVEVSNRLGSSVRPGDTVARLGGDEFGLLLEDVADAETAELVALRIEAELAKPLSFEGREVFVTASIGIALSSERLGTPEEVLRDADLAMYHAKAKGKARHEIFDGTMSAPALDRMDLEMDLRSAITNRDFRLHYQPILRLETGRIVEVEALIRWQHEKRGLLQPDAFIGLTEETGLIVPIGQWVLTEACRQARAWQIEFPRTPALGMSVNLSAKQFQNPKLVEEITDALTMSGLDPACLKLEITESVVMQDVPATLAKLHELKDLGIRLAIDDFGTGYSSLGYLKRFPVDTLKIDRSFVKGLSHEGGDSAIVRAVVTVAKSLNMDVTAEGIETDQQRLELKALGCDLGQGFLFARPTTPEHLKPLLAISMNGALVGA